MAGKENDGRPLWTSQIAQPKSVSKSASTRRTAAAATAMSASKRVGMKNQSGRRPGLSVRTNCNGTPSSFSSTAAGAPTTRTPQEGDRGESAYRGPLRVRVNTTRPEVSLSFWSLPVSAEQSATPSSKATPKVAGAMVQPRGKALPSATVVTASPTPRTKHQQRTSRTTRDAASSAVVDAGRKNATPGTFTRKRARTEQTSTATAMHGGARSSSNGAATDVAELVPTTASPKRARGTGAASTTARASSGNGEAEVAGEDLPAKDSRLATFGTDISHILNWKPAARPARQGVTADAGGGGDAGGSISNRAASNEIGNIGEGSGSAVTGQQQQHQQQQQQQQLLPRGGTSRSDKEERSAGSTRAAVSTGKASGPGGAPVAGVGGNAEGSTAGESSAVRLSKVGPLGGARLGAKEARGGAAIAGGEGKVRGDTGSAAAGASQATATVRQACCCMVTFQT